MSVEFNRSDDFDKNHDRADGTKPHCCACGKNIAHPKRWIHIHHGGTHVVTEDEAAQLNADGHESADMYFFPIGNDCLRKRPELKSYAQSFDS